MLELFWQALKNADCSLNSFSFCSDLDFRGAGAQVS